MWVAMMMVQQMRMMVMMMVAHVHGDTTRYFDFDLAEAASVRVTMNANELFYIRRVGGVVIVVGFLSFGWCEGEPAHVCSLAGTRRN
jgi:hypothetical protein